MNSPGRLRQGLRIGYGVWCWIAFVLIGTGALVASLPVADLALRRRLVRRAARIFFGVAGIGFEVRGLERLPTGPCVVVANHASYLDGVVMHAALPPRFAFVIKQEMVRVPLASLLLRRLGSEFVNRFDHQRGAADARRVLRTTSSGQAIAAFPEGTFVAHEGIGRFHAGAFVVAARAGRPVVPVAIRGTRAVLHPTAILPGPGRIEVEILPPLAVPAGSEREAALSLRAAARRAILDATGEPDLDA